MTDTFTWSNGIQLAALLLTGAAMLLGVWYRIELRIRGVEDAAKKEIRDQEKALAEYKLHVTEEYASWNTVRQIEERLGRRIDELNSLIMKMPDAIMDRLTTMMALAAKK